MNLKRILAGALTALMLLTASCGSDGIDLSPTAEDKKTVMTVGGEKVEYQEYRYFYLNNKRDLFGEGAELTGDDVARLKALTEDNARKRHGLVLMAEKYGAKLTKEAADAADATVDAYRASMGDDATYLIALEAQYMTDDLFRDLSLESALAYAVLEKMIEKGDIKADDTAIDAAFASDEILCLKEIYVSYNTPETKKIAEERAEEALGKLASGESFEAMMREYSDYSEAELPPEHGYYTMKNDALDVIWDTAVTLAPGEHSVVVESPYGYHIVMRCEKDTAYMKENRDAIAESYVYAKFYDIFDPFAEALEVKYTSHGNSLDYIHLD